jgi:flagellin FlaB
MKVRTHMTQTLQQIQRDQRGITGLETAIIMISFVVVASVFAYTVLSAGLFSSEKGKAAVYAGIDNARSSMSLSGSVVAKDTNNDDDVNEISSS